MAIISAFSDNTQQVKDLSTRMVVLQNELDFSGKNIASADVVECLKVPADCFIAKVALYVITIEDSTATCTMGDGTTADGWDASINLASLGANISTEGTDTYGLGKFYTVDDTIDITVTGACDTAKILVVAYGFNCISDLA